MLPGTINFGDIAYRWSQSKRYQQYHLPYVGRTMRTIDQYADYQKMYADYMRNVGREIKYPSLRDYRYQASSIGDSIMSPLTGAGKTVRSLI